MMQSATSAGASFSQVLSGTPICADVEDASEARFRYALRSRAHSEQLARCASSADVGASSTSAARRSVDRCDMWGFLTRCSYFFDMNCVNQMRQQLSQFG